MIVGGMRRSLHPHARRSRTYRPMFEVLEDRSLPALVTTGLEVFAVAGRPFTGPIATFTDSFGAQNPSQYSVLGINWGDGREVDTSTGTISFNGGLGSPTDPFVVSGSHTYAASGTYFVTVTLFSASTVTVVNSGFRGPYVMDNWLSSGIQDGTTSIQPPTGSTDRAEFSYRVDLGDPGPGVSTRTATFSSTAAATGPLSYTWEYTGFHGFFGDVQLLQVFADGPTGRTVRTLVDANIDDVVFNFTGDDSIDITAGFAFGWIVGGGNFDSNSEIEGELAISNLRYPARATVANPPTISGPETALAGQTYTLDLGYDPQPGETVTWTINWGDGQTDVIPGNPNTATHVYAGSATGYVISASVSSSLFGNMAANQVFVSVPLVTISGAPTVGAGQVYTLNLSYEPLTFGAEQEAIVSWTINWGDGLVQVVPGNPSSVTHVYTDAPNGYFITATANTTRRGPVPANDLLVDVLIPSIASADSTALEDPGTSTVTTPDGTATAVVTRTIDHPDPLVVFLAHYGQNPNLGINPNVDDVGGIIVVDTPQGPRLELALYDLRVSNARPGDVVVVFFKLPQPAFLPQIHFIDDVTGLPLPIVGSTDPAVLARFGATPRIVNGAFMIVLDFTTSFPRLSQLRGTVFTITDVAGFVPPIFNLFALGQDATPRNLAANPDVLGALLGGDDDIAGDDGGTLVGAVAPAQVATYATGGSGSDMSEEARQRRQRDILRVVEVILEQLRQVLGMQIHLVTAATPPVEWTDEVAPPLEQAVIQSAAPPVLGQPEEADPIDPFADEIEPAEASGEQHWLSCLALAAIPFVPWADVLTPAGRERSRSRPVALPQWGRPLR